MENTRVVIEVRKKLYKEESKLMAKAGLFGTALCAGATGYLAGIKDFETAIYIGAGALLCAGYSLLGIQRG